MPHPSVKRNADQRRRYMDIYDGYEPPVRPGKYDDVVRRTARAFKRFWIAVVVISIILVILL